MIKELLKKIYYYFPFSFKVYIKDIFLYFIASKRGAKNITKIEFYKDHPSVCVLGNGPSLKKDKTVIEELVDYNDFVCVNNFCDDELYTILKPKIYVFLDAYFFSDNAHPDWIVRRNKTFTIIDRSTTWPMKVVVPQGADVNILKNIIKNENIEIIKINTQGLLVKKYNKTIERLFNSGFYGPLQINVLIYAVYLSVLAGYKEINIFGADLSFHNDVNVDQKSNDLFITFRHFNEEDKVEPLRKNPDKVQKWSLGELLDLTANTFYAHETIQAYAKSKGINIYNCSSFSLIDAYPRKNFQCL